ncbi:preprotein translocase subunit SecA [[Pseudomonas] carboxydohydrogena]|uniref:Protein translocase subunit SecA n=1 Tax=Afipia carboxydohydrogena TaxID=290 RepID=A0ABY8BMV1_AFICR|nr:preprotein translocase subunit SecA [[Pseudomonas] carboxydohydrogena]WEF51310.1 preprotein translocase subunit SecA [[Pseudomonas] carboxydohydrogena]
MILRLARRAISFGTRGKLTRYEANVEQVLAWEQNTRNLSDTALRERITRLRHQIEAGLTLDAVKVEVFALVREAARRALNQTPVPVQIIGALALHDGHIIEMKTGEGKTLTATMVCALNALNGRGVHIATPNDYLAGRDADWMRPVYALLGLRTGVITQEMDDDNRRNAYRCDITYGIASEFGFDYLRDNMKFNAAETVQRGHAFALIDEADATLIDDASMPLALYGPLGDHSEFYLAIDATVAGLQPFHYEIDHRRHVSLTTAGYNEIERKLRQQDILKSSATLHEVASISLLHHVMQSLRAHVLLTRDRDYVVTNGDVTIVDEHTGRPMPGRRYDEGLHQALEAKEGCAIGEETRTLASTTFQTYFRRYAKLTGMTGTAMADAEEYRDIYGLDVMPIPTHRPLIRIDESVLHTTAAGKLQAILREIEDASGRGQPVLLGAPSIEKSEALAAMLEANGWRQRCERDDIDGAPRTFAVLNAKHHAREAEIIARAGAPGAVTIATAMAGRGTDIRLGGEHADEAARARVIAAGGLLVIGTTHHEYGRIDQQLRGRSGRQGDPGRSIIHASLDDDVLTGRTVNPPLFDRTATVPPSVAQRVIRSAQKRHENRSFERRLGLLRFDAIIQRQHDTLYELRRDLRDGAVHPLILAARFRHEVIDDLIERFAPSAGSWDIDGLDRAIRSVLTLAVDIDSPSATREADARILAQRIRVMADRWIDGKISTIGETRLADIMQRLMMALIDQFWSEQSERLNHLKRQIGDRRLPPHKVATEFHLEAFELFESMMTDLRHNVTAHAMRLGINPL